MFLNGKEYRMCCKPSTWLEVNERNVIYCPQCGRESSGYPGAGERKSGKTN